MAHGVEQCEHGVVVRQCRCINHNDVTIVPCDPQLCASANADIGTDAQPNALSVQHTPRIGDRVHYVAYGTPGGEYPRKCRAAVITEVGQWVTVSTEKASSYSRSEGRPIRTIEQWFYADAVALFVMNPTGVFFNGAGATACRHMEPTGVGELPLGGTWHFSNHE